MRAKQTKARFWSLGGFASAISVISRASLEVRIFLQGRHCHRVHVAMRIQRFGAPNFCEEFVSFSFKLEASCSLLSSGRRRDISTEEEFSWAICFA